MSNGEHESPWNVRFYCWDCGEDFTTTIMRNILKEASSAGCEDPLAVANNLIKFGAVLEHGGGERDLNEKEILFMAEMGIALLACQGFPTPETLCDSCRSKHIREEKKRMFKVLKGGV